MNQQQHRDRVEELKNFSSNLRWKAAALLTGYLGLSTIIYLVWYNQKTLGVRYALFVIFIYITFKVRKEVKKTIKRLNEANIKITRNYDKLLGRKK